MDRDHQLFNCGELHELEYVSGLYPEKKRVMEFLKQHCKDGNIKNMTHRRLFAYLEQNEFIKSGAKKS